MNTLIQWSVVYYKHPSGRKRHWYWVLLRLLLSM